MQLKIVLGMVTSTTAVVVQDVKRNSRGLCVEFGGPNRQQQTTHKYVDDPRGRERRPRRGYRWNSGEAFGEGEFQFLKINACEVPRNLIYATRSCESKGNSGKVFSKWWRTLFVACFTCLQWQVWLIRPRCNQSKH